LCRWACGRGRRVVAGPGVAWPKSRFSGCELAAQAMESFPGCPPGPVALAVAARRASVWRRAKMARTAPGRQRLKTRWPECGRSSRRPGRCTPACPAGRSRRRSGAPQGNRPIRPHPGPCKCQTHRPFILVPAGHSMRPVQAQSKRAPTAPRCAGGTSTAVTAPETDMNHIHGTPRQSVTLAALAATIALAVPAVHGTATAAVHGPLHHHAAGSDN